MDIRTTQNFSSFSISRYGKITELRNKVSEAMSLSRISLRQEEKNLLNYKLTIIS